MPQIYHPEHRTDPAQGKLPRRAANLYDLMLHKVEVTELDPSKLLGGEQEKNAVIKTWWESTYFDSADASVVFPDGRRQLGYDLIARVLQHGLEGIPKGWSYQDGILVPEQGILTPDAGPMYPADSEFFDNHQSPEQVKENQWWIDAVRSHREVLKAYVDAAVALAKPGVLREQGYDVSTLMGTFPASAEEGKITVRAWVLDRLEGGSGADGWRRRDGRLAMLVGVRSSASGASAENLEQRV